MFSELLTRFRALSLYFQEAHWSFKGSFFYEDHLLAERLYNEVNDEIDGIAEKGIGATDSIEHVILPEHLQGVQAVLKPYPHEFKTNAEFWTAALKMENELTTFLGGAFRAEKNIGVQNLLQDLAEKGIQRVYLIQRRIKTDK